jgi:hypothetical protein
VTTIQVVKKDADQFQVLVSDGRSQTAHLVTLKKDYYEKLTGGKARIEELVHRSFEFLLEREPKESILRKFDLPVIGRYFPEYEEEIKRRLGVGIERGIA